MISIRSTEVFEEWMLHCKHIELSTEDEFIPSTLFSSSTAANAGIISFCCSSSIHLGLMHLWAGFVIL